MIFFYLSSNLGNFANMTQEYQIRVLPQVAYTEENIKQYIAEYRCASTADFCQLESACIYQ